jgi:hypothetical protein
MVEWLAWKMNATKIDNAIAYLKEKNLLKLQWPGYGR